MLFILDMVFKILFYLESVVILLWLLLVLFTCQWYKYSKLDKDNKSQSKFYGISEFIDKCDNKDTNNLSYIIRYNAIIGGVLYFISLFFRIHPLLLSIGSYLKVVGMILILGTMIYIPIYVSMEDIDNNITLGYSYYFAILPVLSMIIKCIYIL